MKSNSILPTFICGGLLAFSPALHAENSISKAPEVGAGTEHREGRAELMERIARALDLTDAQKEKIKPIIEEKRSKIAALRKNGALSRQEKMAEFKEILQSSKQELKGILTPAQQQKLEEILEKIKEHRREKRK